MDVYGDSLKQFSSERLLCFLEGFVPYEFTVLPSLKCLGQASFRLPLTNTNTLLRHGENISYKTEIEKNISMLAVRKY